MDAQHVTGGTSAGGRVGALLGGIGAVAALTVAVLAFDSTTPAAASGLERFASCADLQAWTEELQAPIAVDEGFDVAVEDSARTSAGSSGSGAASSAPGAATAGDDAGLPAAAPSATGAAGEAGDLAESTQAADGDTGGTNTVVEGVDEIDVIDRVAADRLLVARNGVLALVELSSLTLVAELPGVPYDARVSVADGVVFAAGSSVDGLGTEVLRARVEGDSIVEEGRWQTPGYLLDARRTGDRLHVVAVDHPFEPGAVPFEDGPVPCDEVWRPVEPATTPAATLVATLPATGALAPTAAAEVTGAGGNLLVTADAAYVVTETSTPEGEVSSGIHRFDLDALVPTGSGAVPGSVAGPFALSEHEGHLRVATSRSGGGFVGRPIPVEGDGGIGGDVVVEPLPVEGGPAVDVPADVDANTAGAAAAPAQEEEPGEPTTTTAVDDPSATTITTAPDATTTTVPETTTTTVPETTTTEAPATTTTVPADESALAEVFVLDLEGDLDVVGSTGRFGHDFETIHGVRFVGDVGYVVTFLQTDPFWVLDLADPTAPAVVGELQIPGFSGYLHPITEERVVGFGPDGSGRVAARLFDVADPTAPTVIDEITLGDDSPVAFDHHAFVGLGDARFAVPVTDYPEYVGGDCIAVDDPGVRDPGVDPTLTPGSVIGDDAGGGSSGIAVGEPVPACEAPRPVGGSTGAVVLEVVDGRLAVVEEATIERPDVYAERVVQAPDGSWILLSYDRLAATDGGRELVLPSA